MYSVHIGMVCKGSFSFKCLRELVSQSSYGSLTLRFKVNPATAPALMKGLAKTFCVTPTILLSTWQKRQIYTCLIYARDILFVL